MRINNGRSLTPGADSWALAHPWVYATIAGMFTFFVVLFLLALGRGPLGLAFVIAPAWFCVIGWSMSRGPGRRHVEKRLGRRE
jgi:hypothetical protein